MKLGLASTSSRRAGFNPYMTGDPDAVREHIIRSFVPHPLDVIGRNQVLDVPVSKANLDEISLMYHRHRARGSVRLPTMQLTGE